MYCVFLGRAVATNAPGAGSVNTAAIADNAVTSAKLTYPLTTFSSTGIDDNATSNAMTIESSERVQFTRPRSNTLGDAALEIKPSDTVVGVGFRMENTNNDIVVEKSSPSGSEAEIFRIRSGGGIAIGGTGDANTLSDYEEGTWTPAATGASTAGTGVTGAGRYTKVGNLVHIDFSFVSKTISGASGDLRITGLPFTVSGADSVRGAFGGNVRFYNYNLDGNTYYQLTLVADENTSYLVVTQTRDHGTWSTLAVDNDSGLYIEGGITYTTTA
jgi:hypothetical protein